MAHLKQIQDPRTPIETKALHLSWILHQAGDVHQPLHTVARFSKALPEGDRGGNEVRFPNPRARGGREGNLHAYWDDLLGTESSPAAIGRLAEEITKEHPAANFTAELAKRNIRDWAEENVEICLTLSTRTSTRTSPVSSIVRLATKPTLSESLDAGLLWLAIGWPKS